MSGIPAQDRGPAIGCLIGIHARVTIPDGRPGTVVGTRSKLVHGQMNPLGYQVRLDGAERDGPHPWFLAGMLTVLEQAPVAAISAPLPTPIASEPGPTPAP